MVMTTVFSYSDHVRLWPFGRHQETRSVPTSIQDPALAAYFGVAAPVYAGVAVTEQTALGLSAVFRAVSLIAQSIGQLPLKTYRDTEGLRIEVSSFLDDPGGPDGLTPFEWMELVLVHLLLHGNAFLLHVFNGAGSIAALQPLHPLCVQIVPEPAAPAGKVFRVTLANGTQRTLTTADLTHIPALGTDGLCGYSPIWIARNSLGTAIAGDRAAAKMFANGAMISGLVTPKGDDDITEEEAKAVKEGLDRKIAGWENSSTVAVFNKALQFTPWTLSAEDAQFIESRTFQIEEVARWYGIPPHLLMSVEKTTSWGAGIEEQNRGLSRTVLAPWCARIEQRLSRLLPMPRFVEFDMAGLERGTPAEEINLLIQQTQAGILTIDEARAIRNLPPLGTPTALPAPLSSPQPAPVGVAP